ncbi:unnamed protein product [Adineta ricciae]|uniref:Uncharacterized protein n=1 Tax=Adineta ricciae TaxID=249248 RepID=A0A813XTM1_ADIRI|nr:unnamed protein product [Adineta ricciae]CAF1048096.1 unnamed protein product [Adineta ricciae]
MINSLSSVSKASEKSNIVPEKFGRRRRIDANKWHNVVVVWLENRTDPTDEYFQQTIEQLDKNVQYLDIFMDNDECIEFIACYPDALVDEQN